MSTSQPAHGYRSRAEAACLIVVDVQEKLFDAIPSGPRVEKNIGLLLDSAAALDLPVVVTEHMPQKIGATRAPVAARLPESASIVEKSNFAAWDEPAFRDRIEALSAAGRRDFAVCGMESHVCVQQTALGLLSAGFAVRVVADATGSRDHEDRSIAIERMRHLGCDIVSAEALVFEWLERGDTPAFKNMLRTIRDRLRTDGGEA